jgi:hypothetical protein
MTVAEYNEFYIEFRNTNVTIEHVQGALARATSNLDPLLKATYEIILTMRWTITGNQAIDAKILESAVRVFCKDETIIRIMHEDRLFVPSLLKPVFHYPVIQKLLTHKKIVKFYNLELCPF